MAFRMWTAAVATALLPAAGQAAAIDVATTGQAAMIFLPVSKAVGPFPWSDLGIGALASIVPLPVVALVGGKTSFNLAQPAQGQAFVPGSTKVDLGYAPAWTGSVSSSAFALVEGNLTFGIGPFHDTVPPLTAHWTPRRPETWRQPCKAAAPGPRTARWPARASSSPPVCLPTSASAHSASPSQAYRRPWA